jgi:F-type H+-transporting ATPase subunit a
MDQFEIKVIFPSFLTNISFYIIAVVCLVSSYYYWGTTINNVKMNGWSFSTEAIYFTIHNMVLRQIGIVFGLFFFTFIFTLFIYILFSNLLGLVPYSFATTSHLATTLSLSFSIWFAVSIMGLFIHHLDFFSFFCPTGTPFPLAPTLALIEFVSYVAKGVSLGVRLGANIISGHLLLLILAGFGFLGLSNLKSLTPGILAVAAISAIGGLELGIAGIQSYVFSILTTSYIKDSIFLH